MGTKRGILNKRNGVFYTPVELADFLAKPLITSGGNAIFDPSYGDGALLLAAERISNSFEKNIKNSFWGCDIRPVNGLLNHLPQANLKETDFFDYRNEILFDTILMNPPYIRHHVQKANKIKKYRSQNPELTFLENTSDLWAYFLVKAVSHLEKDGSIGAILPWAFLQADYAKPVRKWLSERFEDIQALALSNRYFESADERVIVLWLRKYLRINASIKIGSSQRIESKIEFKKLNLEDWLADRVHYSGKGDVDSLFSRLKREFAFIKLDEIAEVKIGVVTGAVDYFIIHGANLNSFKKSRLIPILTSSDEFPDFFINGKKSLPLLVSLRDKDHLVYRSFIKKGIENKYHLRSHSKLREPWYSVKVGKVADAFFPYRCKKYPFLLPNSDKVQCTNSIHRIYFKNLTDIEKKWVFVSLLSLPSQLSLELNSKTYGRGILKIEPKSLKETLVLVKNDSVVNSVYNKIISLLSRNNKEEAFEVATKFIVDYLKIPNDFLLVARKELQSIQDLRISGK